MSEIIVDLDDTLVLSGDLPNVPLIDALNAEVMSGDRQIVIVSGRSVDRLEETRAWIQEHGLAGVEEIHLSDFPEGPNASVAFKLYKAERLIQEGMDIEEAIDNDPEVRRGYVDLGLEVYTPDEYIEDHPEEDGDQELRAIDPEGYEPTGEMKAEAEQALEWRRVFGRGGTLVGVARARDISAGRRLPFNTVRRMSSYFARHEVDKEAEGFNRGEDGYPSSGRIAWGLWGGDSGRDWASRIIQEAVEDKAARSVEVEMGIEFRTSRMELRAVDDTGMEFEGYAALYDSPSAEGTTPEIVKDTAFNRSIAAVERGEWDVRAYQDHDPKLLLGTTKSGTLSLKSDGKGLLAKIKLNPEISFHRDLAAIVKSMGNSLGMSFGFWNTNANRVNEDGIRELRDVKLVEVSALTGLAPYYPGTISLVSVRGLAQKAGVDSSDLRDAVAALLAGEATADHASILASAIAASSRDVEGVPTVFGGEKEEISAPVEETPAQVEEAPVAVEEEIAPVVDDAAPLRVPRTLREKELELRRHAVK
jgi:HK97 family phage prohead protease